MNSVFLRSRGNNENEVKEHCSKLKWPGKASQEKACEFDLEE